MTRLGEGAARAPTRRTVRAWCGPLVALLTATACGTSRRDQLHQVAKDWCETIRASQVIAVYPLTQDIQPGDVFLVQTPIDQQQRIFERDGFLPLDNHLARLDPDGFIPFYRRSFVGEGGDPVLPRDWLASAWQTAPAAAFPSYSFRVEAGSGLNLAIPVSGVPVGLSLLGTRSADGSVSLEDARTIGVDTMSLYFQLQRWVDGDRHRRDFLANFAGEPGAAERNYLRVVTRVYLLGAIDVQLNDARTVGAGLDAGAARPVELFLPDSPSGISDTRRSAQENYLRGIQRLNAMVRPGAPLFGAETDHGLTTEEFEIRDAARRAARSAELERARAELEAARNARDDAVASARATGEGRAVADAEADLDEARRALAAGEAALDDALAADPRDPAAISVARNDLQDAERAVTEREVALRAAELAFHAAHGEAIQQHAGRLDVARAALDRLEDFAPGGSFRFHAASSRSVSMSETFDPPLVVGYLGFDVAIGADGELGRPIPTHARLDPATAPPVAAENVAVDVHRSEAILALYDALQAAAADDERAERTLGQLDELAGLVPEQSLHVQATPDGVSIVRSPNARADFGDYVQFRQARERAMTTIEGAVDDGASLTVEGEAASGDRLRQVLAELEEAPAERRAWEAAVQRLFRVSLFRLEQ